MRRDILKVASYFKCFEVIPVWIEDRKRTSKQEREIEGIKVKEHKLGGLISGV